MVKLLCGLLDPTEGLVLLNGKDVRGFNRRSYYDLFSAVFQEFSVLDVTVAEEIAQTTEGIDYDKIADCVEKAGLTTTIEKLPKGMQTHVQNFPCHRHPQNQHEKRRSAAECRGDGSNQRGAPRVEWYEIR